LSLFEEEEELKEKLLYQEMDYFRLEDFLSKKGFYKNKANMTDEGILIFISENRWLVSVKSCGTTTGE
jgi:hypothetical protein